MKNAKIRNALANKKMKQWELAEIMGISEYTLCKRFRKELSEEEQERIIALIKDRKEV